MTITRSYEIAGELAELFDRDDAPVRIDFQFELSRARVESVAVVGNTPIATTWPAFAMQAPPAPNEREESLPPNVVRLDLSGVAIELMNWRGPGRAIVVRSSEEAINLTRLAVETLSEKRFTVEIGEYCGGPKPPSFTVREGAVPLKWWPQDYVDAMRARIEDEPNHKFYKARHYFFSYDFGTHPHLQLLHAKRLMAERTYRSIKAVFKSRIRARVTQRRSGSQPLAAYPYGIAPTIKKIMPLQQGLIRDWYEGDLRAHEAGIRAFANGQLRFQLEDGMWTTQPSSSAFFFFGELAIVAGRIAQRHGTEEESEFWADIAAASVAAQRIYVKAYPPKPGKKKFEAYESCSFTKPICEEHLDDMAPTIARDLDEIECEAAKIADEHLRDEVP